MGSDNTDIGDRMKRYESATRDVLPRRTYTIIRVDINGAHTLLKEADHPFDLAFMRTMMITAQLMCESIPGVAFAFTQSDEISLLLTDFATIQTDPWFGGVVQKIASIAAGMATAHFNAATLPGSSWHRPAWFDGRVFTIPDPVEVGNYFIWRQRDWVRNSVQMAGQAYFQHEELQGLNGSQIQEKLWQEHKVNWSNYPVVAKRGQLIRCEDYPVRAEPFPQGALFAAPVIRRRWVPAETPTLKIAAGAFLAREIPVPPPMPPGQTESGAGIFSPEILELARDSYRPDPRLKVAVEHLNGELAERNGMVTPGAEWRLEGYDSFSSEPYPLGNLNGHDDCCKAAYSTREDAEADAQRRFAQLEKTQPSCSSGGQGGIQDWVYLIHPSGHRERLYPQR